MDLADRMESDLHVVYVGEMRPVYHPERRGYHALYEEFEKRAQRLLDEQVNQLESCGGTVAKYLRMGRPDEEIVVLGEEIAAGLIVTGSRGLGGIRGRSWAVSQTRLSVMPTAPSWSCAVEVDLGVASTANHDGQLVVGIEEAKCNDVQRNARGLPA